MYSLKWNIFLNKVIAPGEAGSNNFVYIQSNLSHILGNTLNLWLYLRCNRETEYGHLKFYSVFAIVLALRNCQFQTQQDNRHERLRNSVGGVYMLCGYGSTFKAYDLPTLFHKVHSRILTTNIITV